MKEFWVYVKSGSSRWYKKVAAEGLDEAKKAATKDGVAYLGFTCQATHYTPRSDELRP